MRVLKIHILLILLFISDAYIAQNSTKFPTDFYKLLQQQKFDGIFALLDTTNIPKVFIEAQKEKMKPYLTQYGKAKKLLKILEDDAGVKKKYALLIQFKKGKKNLNLVLNSNQRIFSCTISDYNETPFFQLKGYQGFSEVTDLTTEIKTRDGFVLGANIAFGDTSKQKSPCVIFVHGSGSHDRDETVGPNKPFRDLAQSLAQKGIVSLRYDKRGYDYIKLTKTQMDSIDLYTEVIDDAIDAVKSVKKISFIDTTKIYIIGHSLGAMCAPKMAELCPQLKGIIMMAGPAGNLLDIIPEQVEYMAKLNDTISNLESVQINQIKWQVEKTKASYLNDKTPKGLLLLNQSTKYWRSIIQYNQIETAKKLVLPIFILNGERDYQVTMKQFEIWKKEFANYKNVQFRSYPKLNHLFLEGEGKANPDEYNKSGHIPQYVIDDLVEFIQ